MTQFAMVEELASLVKDNLVSKHLVLSMEEAFINFLEDNTTCSDGVLELEPMDPYNRLLLHRLADIFGFAHVSVGEGDSRHLILERCPETSVPSILVSDILFQHDEPQFLTTSHQLLRREGAPPVLQAKSHSHNTLEEREAAYMAARQRIFSLDMAERREPVQLKPRTVPVVARRMIAHALGQKPSPRRDSSAYELQTHGLNVQDKDKIDSNSSLGTFQVVHGESGTSSGKSTHKNNNSAVSAQSQRNFALEAAGKNHGTIHKSGATRTGDKKDSKEEHMGAAKRLFAHALGRHSTRSDSHANTSETKQTGV